jgi:hypothetical protein
MLFHSFAWIDNAEKYKNYSKVEFGKLLKYLIDYMRWKTIKEKRQFHSLLIINSYSIRLVLNAQRFLRLIIRTGWASSSFNFSAAIWTCTAFWTEAATPTYVITRPEIHIGCPNLFNILKISKRSEIHYNSDNLGNIFKLKFCHFLYDSFGSWNVYNF